VNEIAPQKRVVLEADTLHRVVSNRRLEVKLVKKKIQQSSTNGVWVVSEFVEINDTTWEVLITLIHKISIQGTSGNP